MRTVIIISLFISALAYSQPGKDSLLARDHAAVIEKLGQIRYLKNHSAEYHMYYSNIPFPIYYKDSIVGKNPFKEFHISQYLGYTGNAYPRTWDQFMDKLFHHKSETILEMIDKYGFPSDDRLIKFSGKKFHVASAIGNFSEEQKTRFRRMLKQEHKLGNLNEMEYIMAEYFSRRGQRSVLEWDQFKKKMAKYGINF